MPPVGDDLQAGTIKSGRLYGLYISAVIRSIRLDAVPAVSVNHGQYIMRSEKQEEKVVMPGIHKKPADPSLVQRASVF